MTQKELITAFSRPEFKTDFVRGAEVLKKEAVANGYKLTTVGLQTFLNNALQDENEEDAYNFYQMCILYV